MLRPKNTPEQEAQAFKNGLLAHARQMEKLATLSAEMSKAHQITGEQLIASAKTEAQNVLDYREAAKVAREHAALL